MLFLFLASTLKSINLLYTYINKHIAYNILFVQKMDNPKIYALTMLFLLAFFIFSSGSKLMC